MSNYNNCQDVINELKKNKHCKNDIGCLAHILQVKNHSENSSMFPAPPIDYTNEWKQCKHLITLYAEDIEPIINIWNKNRELDGLHQTKHNDIQYNIPDAK